MENTSYIVLSQESALRRQMSTIANNLANMNTTGFKAERLLFVDHLVRSKGGENFFGVKNAYVRDVASYRVLEEGPFQDTGNPLDFSLHGPGFFAIQTEQGQRYTRNGHFRIDDNGQLVTEAGNPVLSNTDAPIFLAPEDTNIRVARDGTVSTDAGQIARLRVVDFDKAHQLRKEAGALYTTDQQPRDVERPDVVQGMLEGSNVQAILEMTRMIDVHRAYQSAQNFVEKEDDRIKKLAANLVGANA